MKNTLTQLMLVIYVLAIFKPVIPVVQDAVAHTFWKFEHVATVHFENGKYHVHAEMQQADKDDNNKDRSIPSVNNYETLHAHILAAEESSCLENYRLIIFHDPVIAKPSFAVTCIFIPPPEFS